MAEACPICLLPAADPAACTACAHNHPIHTACAMEMRSRMGRDACPVCTAPIALPRTPLPAIVYALVLLEHGLHLGAAYIWFVWVYSTTFGHSAVVDEARQHIRLVRTTFRTRRALWDDTPDLDVVRLNTVSAVATAVCIRKCMYEGWFLPVVDFTLYCLLATTKTWLSFPVAGPCPTDPTCIRISTINETLGHIRSFVGA